MKICLSSLRAARYVVLALTFLVCCTDPDVDPPDGDIGDGDEEEELTPEEADGIMETFSFIEGIKVTGSVPSVANTALTKTSSKDTIYTLPGIKEAIRISHPESTDVKGIFLTIPGSTFYYNVKIEREERSDTVVITFYDIDPVKIEDEISSGSKSVPVEIIPYDENDQPIDIIERVMTIEKPSTNACNLYDHIWFWEWSVLTDPTGHPYNMNCAGEKNKNEFVFRDCCLGVPFCPVYDENQDPIYDVEIPISLFYTIATEWYSFYSDGLFERQTVERESFISNPGEDSDADPSTFNPCAWTPEIDTRTETVNYYGTHDYVPGDNTITYLITDTSCKEGEIGCGYAGSVMGADLITTCHLMIVSKNSEGGKSIRQYSRGSTGDMEGEILDREKFWR